MQNRDYKLGVIGNAPSSGSTIFSDLLDSTGFTLCGPEIMLFSNKELFKNNIKEANIFSNSGTSTLYMSKLSVRTFRFYSYGLNNDLFLEILDKSKNLHEFIDNFINFYRALRGKPEATLLFEKTPENINVIDSYSWDSKVKFINILRHPIYVYASLRRRGFDKISAITTWYLDVLKYYSNRNKENIIEVRYEDLAKSPYLYVSNFLKKNFDITASPETIEQGLQSNEYRSIHRFGSFQTKLPWNVKKSNKFIDANSVKIDDKFVKEFYSSINITVSRKYAKFYNLLEIPLIDLIIHLGYKIDHSKIKNNTIEYSEMFNNFISKKREFHLEQKDISIFSKVFKNIIVKS